MLSNKLSAKIRSSVPRPAPSVIEDMGALAPAPLISGANAPDNSTRDSAGAGPQTELLTPRTTGAKRPDVLRGMESVHIWLRSEAKSILDAKHGEKTLAQYERNGTRLNLARPQGEPVNLSAYENTASTYYAYRAAVRYYAAKHGAQAVRDYDSAVKREDTNAKTEAWQRVLHFAADLVQYPKDAKPGLPSARAVALGLDDPKPEGAPTRAKKKGGVYDVAKRETSKLKAANSIAKKYPNWRELVWARLVHLKSPWLDHTAIAALTGARPEELRTAKVRKTASGIEIGITGAKVSDEKGQPWRLFEIGNDGSLEYAHLEANVGAAWKDVHLPPGVTDYPDAFSAALARAGAHVMPKAERLSGYVYRHAFASDMKADGASKETIAKALGHAVTKTQDVYGRALGGTAGRRLVSVSAAREVRATHDAGWQKQPQPQITIEEKLWQSPTPELE